MRSFRDFTGKEVIVTAQGTSYKGRVVEMTDTAVLLRSPEGFREVPMDRITSIEPKDTPSSAPLAPSPLAGLSGSDPEKK